MRGLDHRRSDADQGRELESRQIIETLELARLCAQTCADKKGEEIKVLDVRKTLPILDYFIIASGKNRRHLRSMADELRRVLREHGREVPREEGGDDGGRWLLLDFGDAIVHLFDHEAREFYDLDGLWADASVVTFHDSGGRKVVGD